ncbi:MAG: hypothetical protein WB444_03620, partial [Gallionella sp.]
CMDAELRAISAIEERVTTELRLIEADYECIAIEVRARNTLAEKLQQAEQAVVAARARENAALDNIDSVMSGSEMIDGKSMEQQLQVLAQTRLNAEVRALNMQRIRMDAEQYAIQEIESMVGNGDLVSPDMPDPCLNEQSILHMALENGLMATQGNYHATQCNSQLENISAEAEAKILQMALENGLMATQGSSHPTRCNSQSVSIGAEAVANRLLDDIRNTNWRNLIMGSTTLH